MGTRIGDEGQINNHIRLLGRFAFRYLFYWSVKWSYMPKVGKKLHHYVPRFYLQAWSQRKLIYCLQNDEIFRPNLQGVAAQNYFYRLEEISPEDAEFLRREVIAISPEGLRESHERLLQTMLLPHQAKRRLEELRASGQVEDDDQFREQADYVESTIREMNENIHTAIENDFRKHLESLRKGDLSFLKDDNNAATFYRSLSVQYARTNHIKQSELGMSSRNFALYKRIANPLVHIIAVNVGLSLYAARHQHRIILVDNPSKIPFVTGDQPLINLAANPTNNDLPANFDVYYPLSPTKALMILDPSSPNMPADTTVNAPYAEIMNLRMAAHSYRQVFAKNQHQLEAIRKDLGAFLNCFRHGSGP